MLHGLMMIVLHRSVANFTTFFLAKFALSHVSPVSSLPPLPYVILYTAHQENCELKKEGISLTETIWAERPEWAVEIYQP